LGGAFGQVLLRQQLRVSDSRPPGRPRKHLHDRLTALTGERYKRTGEILPDSALEEFKKFDSIFLGAIGHPDVKPGILEVGILLKTRFALDQYINLRPVKLYPNVETPLKDKGPEHIDFVVVRENTGGIYTGVGGVTQKGTPLEVATQVMQYSRPVVGARGEPPSSARRVPSREGMETLPGFPS
jgi:isocitrate/isopropylmalate dehydrogenase